MIIDIEMFDRIKDLTMTDYDFCQMNNEEEKVMISYDTVECILEDLICEIDRLEEKIEDREQDIQDNYRRLNPEELLERINY